MFTRAGSWLLLGAAVAIHVWVAASTFVPIAHPDGRIEYLFLAANHWILPVGTVLAAAALSAVGRWALPATRDSGPFRPLALLSISAFTLLVFVPGASPWLGPWLFVVADLRWWWTALVLAWVAGRVLSARGARVRWDPIARRLLAAPLATLSTVLVMWAVASQPLTRFTNVIHGDEPKYLRYCENFYQGLGFEVGHQRTQAELSPAYQPEILRNFSLLARAIGEEGSNLAADWRQFRRHGVAFRFNRAKNADGNFLVGKNGGLYQEHNPGLSILVFPAYFIDRYFLSFTPGYQGRFAEDLPATNLMFLTLWVLWALSLYALVRDVTGNTPVAWAVSAITMLTMSATAFAFQMYPESAAGIVLCGFARFLLVPERQRSEARTIAMGLAVGALVWLNTRFLPMSIVGLAWAWWLMRRGPARSRIVFTVGCALMLALFCAYAYRLTGSFRPDAMYQTQGAESPFSLADALRSLLQYPIDRIWGWLPHAPIFLLTIPGWTLLFARNRPAALLLASLALALALPSGGHGFTAAAGTPIRHLVSVQSLAALPLAAAVIAWWRTPWFRAWFGALLILSLHTGLAYNLHHVKDVGRFVARGVSGWEPNLLFPWTHGPVWAGSWGNTVLAALWVLGCLALLIAPVRPFSLRSVLRAGSSTALRVLVPVATVVFAGVASAALVGEGYRRDYLLLPAVARARVIAFWADRERCALCASSDRGEIDRRTSIRNGLTRVDLGIAPTELEAGSALDVTVDGRWQDAPAWGRVIVDYGDESLDRIRSAYGPVTLRHRFEAPGTYNVTATFLLDDGTMLKRGMEVFVYPAALLLSDVRGLPPSTDGRTPIDRIEIGSRSMGVDVRGRRDPGAIWVVRRQGSGWQALRPDQALSSVLDTEWVGVLVTGADGVASERVFVRWPSPAARMGAPVVVYEAAPARPPPIS